MNRDEGIYELPHVYNVRQKSLQVKRKILFLDMKN